METGMDTMDTMDTATAMATNLVPKIAASGELGSVLKLHLGCLSEPKLAPRQSLSHCAMAMATRMAAWLLALSMHPLVLKMLQLSPRQRCAFEIATTRPFAFWSRVCGLFCCFGDRANDRVLSAGYSKDGVPVQFMFNDPSIGNVRTRFGVPQSERQDCQLLQSEGFAPDQDCAERKTGRVSLFFSPSQGIFR